MRPSVKAAALCESAKMSMPGRPRRSRRAKVLRAPKKSHMGPARMRITIVPVTAKAPASDFSLPVSPRPSGGGFE